MPKIPKARFVIHLYFPSAKIDKTVVTREIDQTTMQEIEESLQNPNGTVKIPIKGTLVDTTNKEPDYIFLSQSLLESEGYIETGVKE